MQKTDILAFGAHPDDIEFGCGGILLHAASQGQTIALCDLTLGDKGSNGTPEERRAEALQAAKLLNAERTFLEIPDCEIADDYATRLKLVEVIRHFRPRLILAPLWQGTGSHPDHFATGSLARAATRYARFAKILPHLPPHHTDGILHYLMPWEDHADFLIDITPHLDDWRALIACHESQHQTKPYLDWCLRSAAHKGREIDVEYAQGLVKGNPIVIDDLRMIARGSHQI
jgi:N-acetylglucosamine malate deacetylase 1